MALPSGYTPLEYIESTGSQYVDTGFKHNNNTRVVMKAQVTTKPSSHAWLFEGRTQDASHKGVFLLSGSTWTTDYLSGKSDGHRISYSSVGVTDLLNIDYNKNVVTINGYTHTYTAETFQSNYNLVLFAANTAGTVAGYISARIWEAQIYDNGTLVRHFLPCTNPSGEVGLYDDVNGVFYGNAGTGTFIAGPVAIYTELEYIESDGTQYVDVGFKPNQDTRLDMTIEVLTSPTSDWPFGVRKASAVDCFALMATNATSLTSWFGTQNVVSTVPTLLQKVRIDKDKAITTLSYDDGTVSTLTNTAATFQSEYNLFLLNINLAGTPAVALVVAKIYSCQIYDNGTLVRDYIPVQRLDGTVGLLDQVNNVFYPDAAGGNFIAGPVAAQPEAPASLELIGTTRNAAVLAWSGAPVGQNYRLYRDGVVIYEGSDLCCTDAGLAAGSTHVYSVHTVIGSTESEGVTTEATTTEGIVLITDRTAADVSAGRRKGYYNALDLIRVGEAMLYAQGLLTQSGYGVSIAPKLDWQLSDIPTHAQMERYLSDIRTLRSAMDLLNSTPQAPSSASGLTWSKANDIEKIIESIEYTVEHVFAGLFRAGQFDALAGDRRPFPTANSDMGRTWEGLDSMGTTWANWELATWYLLLYGNLKEEGVVS